MKFNELIQNHFLNLIKDYETCKSEKARYYNTVIASYNILRSSEDSIQVLQNTMIKSVSSYFPKLKNDEQKKKFFRDNLVINPEYFKKKLSEDFLIDTCSLIEHTFYRIGYIVNYSKEIKKFKENEIEQYENDIKKRTKNQFKQKYVAVDTICKYIDSEVIPELDNKKEFFKYIFFLRNCLVHNGNIASDYFVTQQNIVIDKLEELDIHIFEEGEKINLDIAILNELIIKLREIIETIILVLYRKIEIYFDEKGKEKFNKYEELITVN